MKTGKKAKEIVVFIFSCKYRQVTRKRVGAEKF